MSDYIQEEIEKAAFDHLKNKSPGMLGLLLTFIGAGYSTDEIISVCREKSGRSVEELAFIGCACDYLQRSIIQEKT